MGFVFKLHDIMYAVNGHTSGVLPLGVAKLNWAILTPHPSHNQKDVESPLYSLYNFKLPVMATLISQEFQLKCVILQKYMHTQQRR